MNISIPVMQVRHGAAIVYDQWQGNRSKSLSLRRALNMRQQQRKQYSGQLSPGARKRLAKAVTLLVQSSKARWITNPVTKRQQYHKLSFITLTVSDHKQLLTGKDAYKLLLSHFLAWLRRTEKVTTYVWKAELQQNGQIHYHITTPTFIHYQRIRDKWNNLQRKAGLLKKYMDDFGKDDPNSTDVHEVFDTSGMQEYFQKYISKSLQNTEALGGKVWDCSQNLKANKYFTVEVDRHHREFIAQSINEGLCTCYTADRFSILKFKEPVTERLLKPWELKQFRRFCKCIRDGDAFEFQPPSNTKLFSNQAL